MRSGTALIVALITLASTALAQDTTWLMRYDAESSGVTDASIELPASLLWKYTTEEENFNAVATPAVDETSIYAPVGDTIYALDRGTGALRWQQTAGDEILSSPAIADGVLYCGTRDNSLLAIDTSNGSLEWRFRTQGPVDGTPVIAYGVAYFGSDGNRLTALDLETRNVLWQFEANGDIKAPPLVYRDVIIVGTNNGRIYSINAQGQPLWSNTVESGTFFASPVGERTKVIYASGRELVARDIYTGRLVWGRPFRAGGLIIGSPAVLGRTIYVGSRDGAMYAIDANRGAAMWKWPRDGAVGPISSSPVVAGDKIIFRAGERDIMAISLDGRQLLWQYTLPEVEQRVSQAQPGMFMPEDEMMMEGMPPGAMMDEPMDVGGPGMDGRQPQRRPRTFEELVDPSVAVVENALYTLGDDGIVYAFDSLAPDNIAPTIADPVLEVPGAQRRRVQFHPELTDPDRFPERYADEIEIPGTPPIFLSVLVNDEGSGVNPEQVSVTINGEPASYTYDSREGLVWYIYDPRGAAANLTNGVKQIAIEAVDWRGNRATKVVAFTVDNSLRPPTPPRPQRPQFEEGFPMDMPPEEMPMW
ncbi:MAG: PQQ-binding-like beta-propeller repeat protein [Armatimonadota bacterium]|jgi:outer membrane protein assembly factor BamB